MAHQKGTGKHPHKETQERRPHTQQQQGQSSGAGTARAPSKKTSGSDESASLKNREYEDNQGNIHHRTKKNKK